MNKKKYSLGIGIELHRHRTYSKNDFRIGMLSIIVIIAFVAYLIWTIIDAYAYGESDFVLEMKNASTINEELTLFAIEGESYRGGICPSGQCNLEYIDPNFSPPNPDRTYMSFGLDFILRDTVPNPNIGPNEKSYLERFSVSNYGCRVDDIIEDNGREMYACHDGTTTVTRTFDSKSWDYNTNLIYDAKKNTLKIYGNYTGTLKTNDQIRKEIDKCNLNPDTQVAAKCIEDIEVK